MADVDLPGVMPREKESEEIRLLKRKISSNRMKLVADIILIIVLVGIFSYIYSEIENFKTLNNDVCRLCEQSTGGTCAKFYNFTAEKNIELPSQNYSLPVAG